MGVENTNVDTKELMVEIDLELGSLAARIATGLTYSEIVAFVEMIDSEVSDTEFTDQLINAVLRLND